MMVAYDIINDTLVYPVYDLDINKAPMNTEECIISIVNSVNSISEEPDLLYVDMFGFAIGDYSEVWEVIVN